MKIIFMGTPEFAVPAFNRIIESPSHQIIAVYTQPPRPAGRGQKESKSPIHLLAEKNDMPVFTPASLKSEEEQQKLKNLNADIGVVAAYGLILPQAVLDAPRYGCLNIHPSLLPRWRGAAPIQRTIMAGDDETGVCIMQMDAGLDTGDVILQRRVPVDMYETAGALHDRLSQLGASLLLDAIAKVESGTATRTKQSDEGVTYASKIDKKEAKIDWKKSATEIERLVRGLNPFPGAYFEMNGERIKVLEAETEDSGFGIQDSGKVIAEDLQIACGKGVLKLRVLQRAGKITMPVSEFLKGFKIPVGTILG